jgi:putative ABC transport system substrate-binding protein
MRRRHFIAAIGGGVFAALEAARAQQTSKLPVIGFLNTASPETYAFNANAFRDGLREAGFIDGDNVKIEYRWAQGNADRLPALATELVQLNVLAIAATGDVASARAAQGATSSIPIVFTIGGDPVRFKLVDSMNRPGRNITGVSLLTSILGAKRIELLRETAPKVRRVGLLMNPSNPNAALERTDAEAGAKALGIETVAVDVQNPQQIADACAELERQHVDGLFIATDPLLLDQRAQIIDFARTRALPAIYFVKQFSLAGGLLSYGPSITWMYHQAGKYIGQIVKGGRPSEMPVLQPTQFELVINMKAAMSLGLELPATLLARADEVIE